MSTCSSGRAHERKGMPGNMSRLHGRTYCCVWCHGVFVSRVENLIASPKGLVEVVRSREASEDSKNSKAPQSYCIYQCLRRNKIQIQNLKENKQSGRTTSKSLRITAFTSFFSGWECDANGLDLMETSEFSDLHTCRAGHEVAHRRHPRALVHYTERPSGHGTGRAPCGSVRLCGSVRPLHAWQGMPPGASSASFKEGRGCLTLTSTD